MDTTAQPQYANRFNLGSLLVLLAALGLIVSSVIYLFLAFQQPSDGWIYQTRMDGQLIALGPIVDWISPIHPGDVIQEINDQEVNGSLYHTLEKAAGWQNGGTARYTIIRAGQRMILTVPLGQRSLLALPRYYQESSNLVITILLWYAIGFAIFFLRPKDTAAQLLLLFTTYWNTISAFLQADNSPAIYYYQPGLFAAAILLNSLWVIMFALIIHFVLVFPVKKWPMTRHPRITLAILYGTITLGTLVALGSGQIIIINIVLAATLLGVVVTLVATTYHNLRFLKDPAARAQVGWVILGVSAPIIAAIFSLGLQTLFPTISEKTVSLLWSLSALLLPLCFGIAITRYRLYDIDLIIRRTLQYGVLSLLLGLVYYGMVILLGQVIQSATGQQSPLVIVVSTLVIAGLFNPLRRRVQDWIDRRFYRQQYDAVQAVQSFAVAARSHVELETLANRLVETARESLQPEDVWVWIRRDARQDIHKNRGVQ